MPADEHFADSPLSVPVEQIRALIRLLRPDHLTPMGARMIERVCAEAEGNAGD